jgi:Skp family chaperone for outer membrane proteins
MRNKNIGMWCVAVVFCGAVMWFIGCNRGNSAGAASEAAAAPTPSLGMVNMDTVFSGLGWTSKLKTDVQTYQNQLKAQIDGYATRYRTEVEAQQKEYMPNPGDKLTPSQADILNNAVGGVKQELARLNQEAAQAMQTYQSDCIRQYREALLPVTREVAQSKKMTVAMVQTDIVLFADPQVDLTNAVVDAARAHMPTLTEIPMAPLPAYRGIHFPGSTTQPTTGSLSTTAPTTKP